MERSCMAHVNEPALSGYGWDCEGNIIWIGEAYPSSLKTLLVDVDKYFCRDCMIGVDA